MGRVDAPAVAALEEGMRGDQHAVLEDPHLLGVALDLDHALTRCVGDAVEVAADRDHALVADPPLHGEHALYGKAGCAISAGVSSVKCSATTRPVVACTRALAIPVRQPSKRRPRKKSCRT
jgi:hypothetical protein